jgi:diaminopimelate epimerase
VFVDCLSSAPLNDESEYPALARFVSNPNTGIGSDGLILLWPSPQNSHPHDSDEDSDVTMRIFNKDGSEARNCGNGLRCVALLMHMLYGKSTCRIRNGAGFVSASTVVAFDAATRHAVVHVGMSPPVVRSVPEGVHVNVGNTHVVALMPADGCDLPDDELESRGRRIESLYDANAIFVRPTFTSSPPPTRNENELMGGDGGYGVRMRVWERGSGITAACGTGACAAAVALIHQMPSTAILGHDAVNVQMDGGSLRVAYDINSHQLSMQGDACWICSGTFLYQSHQS